MQVAERFVNWNSSSNLPSSAKVLALEAHPDDIETLTDYGDLPEHLADLISDYDDG